MARDGAAEGTARCRVCLVAIATTILVGCKVVLLPGQGGRIERSNGTWCEEADICELRIDTADFHEQFAAVPEPGWQFAYWKKRVGGLCGGSDESTCSIDTTGFAAFPALMAILDSDARFFMEPVFEPAEPLEEEWSKVFVIDNATAFCGYTGSGIPIAGRRYSSRLTRYSNGLLKLEPLDGGFLGIEDPLSVKEYFWLSTPDGRYLHQFRWEWDFEGEWRLARGNVTWQLDEDATSLSTRQFMTVMHWPDIFPDRGLSGVQCKFTTLSTGQLDPGRNSR